MGINTQKKPRLLSTYAPTEGALSTPGAGRSRPDLFLFALARLVSAMEPAFVVLAGAVQSCHRVRGQRYEISYWPHRGVPLLDRYTSTVRGPSEGTFGGSKLYLLDRGGYAIFTRRGSWVRGVVRGEERREELWQSSFERKSPAEVYTYVGGERGAREVFVHLGRLLWSYAHRHPYEGATRQIENLGRWVNNCALGKISEFEGGR